jgi:hypothetical protein
MYPNRALVVLESFFQDRTLHVFHIKRDQHRPKEKLESEESDRGGDEQQSCCEEEVGALQENEFSSYLPSAIGRQKFA